MDKLNLTPILNLNSYTILKQKTDFFHCLNMNGIMFQEIEWSPDSEYVLCYSIKKVIIQIFSMCYPEWKFKLIEGSSSLESVTWTPDSKNIVVVADLKVNILLNFP